MTVSTLFPHDHTVNHVIIVCWETSQNDKFESVVNLLNLCADPRNRSIRRALDIFLTSIRLLQPGLIMVNHQTAHHKINFRFRNLLQKNWPISWKDMDHVSTFSQVDNGQKITFLTAVNHKKTFDEEFTVSQG